MISPELTIVVPTYNERENVRPLVDSLDRALQSVSWEVIFVDDDSRDGTAAVVRKIGLKDPRVRCLQRIGRRGLSSACIEGMLATPAPYLAVMDGDLQHDEELLPKMLTILQENDLDVVIGSRYMEGGRIGAWEQSRIRMSRIATFLGRIILKAQLSDPMSGFFMLKRGFFEKTVHHMTGKGFKVLLDLFASAPSKVRFEELPYRFRQRQAGASKLDTMAVAEYFLLLADKTIGRFIPLRFLMFVAMGSIGALAHLTVLGLFYLLWGRTFLVSQTSATLIAMTVNFILNNLFTFRDRRLHGYHLLMGLFTFYLACGVGVFLNLRIATFLFDHKVPWWLAGLLGATVGGVWNYSVTSTFTWTEPSRPEQS